MNEGNPRRAPDAKPAPDVSYNRKDQDLDAAERQAAVVQEGKRLQGREDKQS